LSVAAHNIDRRDLSPYRITAKAALVLFFLSLFVHVAILMFASKSKLFPNVEKQEGQLVDVKLLNRPVLDTFQETAKEKPKDAKFESSRNLKAEEDTSPDRAPSSVAQRRGEEVRAKPKSASKQKNSHSEKIMSFTQDDLIAKGEIQPETLSGDRSPLDSSGFAEKLRKGAELKISALESDYGQYITRMKRKISQQWNPQRTISAKMYNFNEVRVDIALVLNRNGEIVDLKILNGSFFPAYDSETKRAVQEASPFPNPPKSLIQSDEHIYMPWSFTLFMNQAGAFHVE
jgi:TonB family protein